MFKITIRQIAPDKEEEVVVNCHEITDEVISLVEKLKTTDTELFGVKGGEVFRVPVKDVLYVESVDNKTYLYLRQSVYETKSKLYEIEEQCRATKLFRCSKSMIVNIAKIRSVLPSVNGRLEARLQNDETVIVSRQYVAALKKKLGM